MEYLHNNDEINCFEKQYEIAFQSSNSRSFVTVSFYSAIPKYPNHQTNVTQNQP